MPRIEKSIVIAASPEQVWAVSSDYNQWHTWFVGLSAPRYVDGDGGLGTVIEHTVTVYNIPMPLKTTVTVNDLNARWHGEYTGPLTKGSQEWTFVAVEEGTEVTLVMETELMGPAKLAEKMVVKSFDAMTEQAMANLKARVEA
jgi:ribosome-associated toxin RatA of RatAB toxin-antitoxin module